MSSTSYSFIDVAVLDDVRERFAAGEAMLILTSDLAQVLWANGAGATLLGHDDIAVLIGSPNPLSLAARRQIAATRGFPDIGRDRHVTVRISTGMTSRAIDFLASAIAMPDGEAAILLTVPLAEAASRAPAEVARRVVAGFGSAGYFAAMLDAEGDVVGASPGFETLSISADSLGALADQAATAGDRLVKRIISGRQASFPAGLARLKDDPALHLLVVADERQFGADQADHAVAVDEPAEAGEPADDAVEAEPAASEYVALEALEPERTPAEASAEPEEAEPGTVPSEAASLVAAAASPEETPAKPASAGHAKADHDGWYFAVPDDEATEEKAPAAPATAGQAPATQPEAAPSIDRTAAPVRFVWRTDAEGRFSAISPEFRDAVGDEAADVVGQAVRDVVQAFGLDPDAEIVGLLERRDTWSGRSVLWPVAGTNLRIPVDLAALPVYGRDRSFQGFRGFGVARSADAVVDAEALGLTLVAPAPEPASPTREAEPEVPTADSGAEEPADSIRAEVSNLTVVPKPERGSTDKIIHLAEHRPAANDKRLSPGERSAFREIGERLKKDSNTPAAVPSAAPAPLRGANDEAGKPQGSSGTVQAPGEAESLDAKSQEATTVRAPEAPHEEMSAAADRRAETEAEPAAAETDAGEGTEARADSHSRAGAETAAEAEAVTGPGEQSKAEAAAAPIGSEADETDSSHADEAAVSEAEAEDAAGAQVSAFAEKAAAAEDAGSPVQAAAEATRDQSADPAGPVNSPRPIPAAGFIPSAFAGEGPRQRAPDTSIIERLPVPLLIHAGDVLHYANPEFLNLTGYESLEQLEDAGGIGALFMPPYRGDPTADQPDRELHMITRDGQEFPIEALLRSVPWKGGKALMLVVRRAGEEPAPAPDPELEARLVEMRTIIDTATDGVVLILPDGTIRGISRPAEALFGFNSEEVAGKPFVSLFAIESQRAARDYLNSLSQNGVASVLNDGREVIGREAQGRFIPLFMTIGRLPRQGGFCAVVRDITPWKRAEEELTQARALAERASSQKSDFLARISHEIRTPLNAIIGFSELMMDEKFGPVANDRYRDYLRDINRSGNHVLALVNDLLDISKIEAGQQEMAYEAVSLNDTLAETVAMMQPQANRERVIIRSSFASKLPDVVADLRSVRQIALNILSNAIRYTQAGGQVIVSTAYESSGDIVMRVRDTGIGMSQTEIEQALKPFKQINSLKRPRGDGTGLGLPLTKAMVEANRAKFVITSTPGEGTLVEITFPATRVLAG